MKENDFAAKVREAGGRAFLVGGAVRDMLLGKQPDDRDYMVTGLSTETFVRLFPDAFCVGNSFPVYLLTIGGRKCEVAFARRERKQGRGYRGFTAVFDADITPEEDLVRRDLTMNSIAQELPEGTLIDPVGGLGDIKAHLIRANTEHFAEDPVRALRAARLAAQHGFAVTDGTLDLMRRCGDELADEPNERLVRELTLALASRKPSIFFRVLSAAGLLATVFPELYRLIGKTQPAQYHPEGDAFEHTMQVADKAAALTEHIPARFAALAHDLGKGTTPAAMLPHHYGHENRGLTVLSDWNRRMTLPHLWVKAARLVIAEHMRAPRLKKPGKIAALLLKVERSTLPAEDFAACIMADHGSLPPFLAEWDEFRAAVAAADGKNAPPELTGPDIGAWVKKQQAAAVRKLLSLHNREENKDNREENKDDKGE